MSFLAPLYFLGALAVVGPIVFHLIRRQPRGEFEFSSLMFLDATPPKLTRRSRLENWPLLLLRCAAICMLAFAFARPYLPMQETESVTGIKQAIVLLVDTSASMKRQQHWDQVIEKANVVIEDAPGDALISVIGFDASPKTELSFTESSEMTVDAQRGAATEALSRLKPTWNQTDIGSAIRFAADQVTLLDSAAPEGESSAAVLETRVVLLSDLQSGAAIETLQGYEWPERVWLDVVPIGAESGNASLRVLPPAFSRSPETITSDESGQTEQAATIRVQVSHHGEAKTNTFSLRFDGQDEDAALVQVPPGEMRYVSVKLPIVDEPTETKPNSRLCLRLSGDDVEFDNAHYMVRHSTDEQSILFFGEPPKRDEAPLQMRERLSFYAEQLPWSDTTRKVSFSSTDDAKAVSLLNPTKTPLVILGKIPADTDSIDPLQQYLDRGGRVLLVLSQTPEPTELAAVAKWLDSPELQIEESQDRDYALINSVDFQDPLIAPLADPAVSDFSSIRIWKHQRLTQWSDQVHPILTLDNDAPLLMRRNVATKEHPHGAIFVLSAGWQPGQSQFALSTKFVPIMLGILGPHRQQNAEMMVIGQSINDQLLSEPGFQTAPDGNPIAVNIDPREGETSVIDPDRLSQFGAVISSPQLREQESTAQRALRDVELESKQGWWQWLIVATIGFLAAETWLSGRSNEVARS